MAQAVVVKLKFVGKYAEQLRSEGANRRMSMAALASEYAMRGMDAERNDGNELAGLERRLAATILNVGETGIAISDTVAAMLDMFILQFFLHFPEPVGEHEALLASAMTRHERFIQQVADHGFEGNRPLALAVIGKRIQAGMDMSEDE